MEVINLPLSGLKLIKPNKYIDERGFFLETFNAERYWENEIYSDFIQDNHSRSIKGVVRGLHFQKTPGQDKLVRCTNGIIWDVAVDIRKDSPTFGQYHAEYLNSSECYQFYIPSGFAHGFLCISNSCDVEYKITTYHDAKNEMSIAWDDQDLKIAWPESSEYILSEKDKNAMSFIDYSTI